MGKPHDLQISQESGRYEFGKQEDSAGGSPTCKDRVYASIMGSMAVDLLCQGKTNRVVGYKDGKFTDFDIEEALAMKKSIPDYQYQVAKTLAL